MTTSLRWSLLALVAVLWETCIWPGTWKQVLCTGQRRSYNLPLYCCMASAAEMDLKAEEPVTVTMSCSFLAHESMRRFLNFPLMNYLKSSGDQNCRHAQGCSAGHQLFHACFTLTMITVCARHCIACGQRHHDVEAANTRFS